MSTSWGNCARVTLAALIGVLAGCGNAISDSDVQFVTAAMPTQFEAFRMYGAVPVRDGSNGLSSHGPARLQQGCEAVIHSPRGAYRESVVLDGGSAEYFELDVSRTPDGWVVTTDGLAEPSSNSVGLRTQFTNCLTAIKDKLRAQPDKVQ
ncbi:hypothetical protein [Paraburkholderia sp. J7]|uniref:hypothetical protein n=1 Tax=Paraburkholderia sp. J7 TaxID=2805438 RepID=UPI002AB78A1D|nr:hypothetical protein [Paraburkholderia sp. J7]